MKRTLLVLAALAPLAAAACEPAVRSVTQSRLYSPTEFRFAAGGKTLYTVIRGNPFDAPQFRVEGAVIAAMQRGMLHTDTALTRRPEFTTDAAAAARPDYRVALVLNPAAGVDAAGLCADSGGAPIAPPGDGIVARMAFCHLDRVLSTSHGTLASAEDPADPRFGRMIAFMTRELFPFRNFRDGFNDGGSKSIN